MDVELGRGHYRGPLFRREFGFESAIMEREIDRNLEWRFHHIENARRVGIGGAGLRPELDVMGADAGIGGAGGNRRNSEGAAPVRDVDPGGGDRVNGSEVLAAGNSGSGQGF